MNNSKLLAHAAILFANIIFGLGIPVTKLLLNDWVSPMTYMATRSLGAAVVFWIIACFMKPEKVERRDLLVIMALNYTSPVYFSLIATLTPVAVMLTAALFIGERITGLKFLGVLLGIGGAVLMVVMGQTLGSGSNDLLGISLAILSVLTWAIYMIITRKVTAKYTPVTQMKYIFLISAIVTVPLAWPELSQQPLFSAATFGWEGALEMAFIVLMATVLGYFLIPYSMKTLSATTVSIYTNLQPMASDRTA